MEQQVGLDRLVFMHVLVVKGNLYFAIAKYLILKAKQKGSMRPSLVNGLAYSHEAWLFSSLSGLAIFQTISILGKGTRSL